MSNVQVAQRVCAVLSCRRRSRLIPTKSILLGRLLVQVDLCSEHEAEHVAGLHEVFQEHFGVDFVDPEAALAADQGSEE